MMNRSAGYKQERALQVEGVAWTNAQRQLGFPEGRGGAESNGVGSTGKEDGMLAKLSRQGLVCVAKTRVS